MICDACGKPLQVQDDDSLYCPFCGQTYGPGWTVSPAPDPWEPSPAELLEMEREKFAEPFSAKGDRQ